MRRHLWLEIADHVGTLKKAAAALCCKYLTNKNIYKYFEVVVNRCKNAHIV